MRTHRATSRWALGLWFCAAGATAHAQVVEPPPPAGPAAPTGPIIEMPDEAPLSTPEDQNTEHEDNERMILQGLTPSRMEQDGTVIGGYGELNLTSRRVGSDGEFDTQANLRRMVLFVAHHLSQDIQVYTELEWEHALACASCEGSVEVEQAFVQWALVGDALALRAGLLLVPMGIVNQWHEPPVFHGVERPATDTWIIPTTWRELGLGIAGEIDAIYRYELYLTTTVDPARVGPRGLLGSSHLGSRAPADAFAVTGRFEVQPWLGVIGGLALFASDIGGNAKFVGRSGAPRDLALPLLGYAADARVRRLGFEARVLWVQFFMPNAGDLTTALREDGSPYFPNAATTGAVPERIEGGYLEFAYNVLRPLGTQHELLGFVRLETYDTQAAVPDGFERRPALDVDELTTGITYRPIPQLAVKADVQLRDRRLGYDELQLNAGVGYMF